MKALMYAVMCCGLFVGCGGDSSDSSSGGSNGAVSKTNGTVDRVSYTESVIGLNGRSLDASLAEVSYDDNEYGFDKVTVGMTVEVSYSDGNAQRIVLEPTVTGQISSLSADQITVNGLTFNYSSNGLAVGDWVLVFARMHPDGSWETTSINKVDALSSAEIEGSLSGLDSTLSTFILGTVTVEFDNASVEDSRQLVNGMWVEVFGQFVDGRFVASVIDIKDNDDFEGLELEGIVTWVSEDKSLFEVAGHLIITVDDSTVFDDGNRESLLSGAIVELELEQSGDSLVATRVDFEAQLDTPDNFEFKVEGEAAYLNGELSINGIAFEIMANTQFDDGLTVGTLNGSWLELVGKQRGGQNVLKEIELEERDNEISLEGLVENNTMWGYMSSDSSLATFNGQWVDIECQRNGDDLTLCRLDPD
ncbi:DUF5666 domain-containing protein [Photobacterium sp. SDRW27]|uniref:DUF5666 domain-containing protein n=1 Tax=Photobacterium obscurum TaxID=2829490 RepID=UPI0022439C23|nr:DUF5666 domain-containing protein [Photobacterium obscurum]MCW8327726.1 DUF5666 domain-containing protein [Photobacterium obscurum]